MAQPSRPSSRFRPRHRGIASIEFLLSVPFLLLLMAMIHVAGLNVLSRAKVAAESRHVAWKNRDNMATRDVGVFNLGNSISNNSRHEASNRVTRYRFLLRRSWTAKSRNVVLAGSWDHRQIEFSDNSFVTPPHFDVVAEMAQGGAQGVGDGLANLRGLFSSLLSF